jgi:hypothetical protein
MLNWNQVSWMAGILLWLASCAPLATGAETPADLCSLLPASVVSKTLGSTYSSPTKTVAPRPFPNTNSGTDCTYESGSHSLLFRAYVDPSPSASAALFAKLKMYFGSGSTDVSGVGDEAYMDKLHGIHVRKGKVRYYITGPRDENQVKALAIGVAAQL